MREIEAPFKIDYSGMTVTVSEHEVGNKRVFHVDFGSVRKALNISVGLNSRDQKFWTSIPEGRQKEAEEIGKLIAQYIRAKK